MPSSGEKTLERETQAGVITRRASFGEHVHARDFGYSVVFYLLVNAARAGMVLGVYPILRSIGYGMGKREAVFVVWGGLHGAVGLALAMNVQAQLTSDRRTGDLVLFHVAAVSFLSMIINGTTARYVLQALGLVKTPGARLKLRARVREAIEAKAADAYQKGRIAAERDLDDDATQHVTALRRAREKDESRAGGDPSVEPTPGFDVAQAEQFVESFRGAPVEDDEVSMLRETFYRILKVEYRSMVETGELPRHSLAALHLERAANRGLDNTHKPIHDYKLLRKEIGATRLDKTTDAFFKRLDACLGARCTLDNRLHYALAYERHETAYHVSRAIVAAHRRAQFQLAEFYGNARRAGDAPETAAEAQVVLESARQCAAVERNVERIPPGLSKIVDTDVVAHHVLDFQHELCAELVHRGVLTQGGAAEVCRDLETDREAVKAARRRRELAIALLHVDRRRGRELDLSESQRQILELRMANAFRSASLSTIATSGETAP